MTVLFLQKRDTEKQIWLLTYGSSCQSITHEMLLACNIEVDECYTVTWRESKYTLFHLSKNKRVRIAAINKTMLQLKEKYGVIEGGVYAFDSIACNTKNPEDDESLESHPGFKHITDVLNKKRDALEWWMQTGDLVSNRKGLLWKHIEDTDVTTMTRTQLVKRAREWDQMKKENKTLKETIEFLQGQIQDIKREHDDFVEKADETLHRYIEKSEECNKLLIENARLRSEAASKGM